jgi:secreted trypsin-like serine protease
LIISSDNCGLLLVAGSLIDVEVELTANHKGQFQLKICPIGSGQTDATQAHRNSHLFLLATTISEEVPVHNRLSGITPYKRDQG